MRIFRTIEQTCCPWEATSWEQPNKTLLSGRFYMLLGYKACLAKKVKIEHTFSSSFYIDLFQVSKELDLRNSSPPK